MSLVCSGSTCSVLEGDVGVLDRLSVDELRTGVEVWKASCICFVCLLLLFGVFCKGHGVARLSMAKSQPGRVLDSSVA